MTVGVAPLALAIGKKLDQVVFVDPSVIHGSAVSARKDFSSPEQLTVVVITIPGLGHALLLTVGPNGDSPGPEWRLTADVSSHLQDVMYVALTASGYLCDDLADDPDNWGLAEMSDFASRSIAVEEALVPVALAFKGREDVNTFQSFPKSEIVTLWRCAITEAVAVQHGWPPRMENLVISVVHVWGDTPAVRIETPEGGVPDYSSLVSHGLRKALMRFANKYTKATTSSRG